MKKLDTCSWVERATEKHGDTYDYSSVIYVNSHSKVVINCRTHGPFEQTAYIHLQCTTHSACPKCAGITSTDRQLRSLEWFVGKAREIHGNLYEYDKVVYRGLKEKVDIVCNEHGLFRQNAGNHLNRRSGCPKCAARENGDKFRSTLDKFIAAAIKTHGSKYDYSYSIYINGHTPMVIVCPVHGGFSQAPADHVDGHGCASCAYVESPGGHPRRQVASVINQLMTVHGSKYTFCRESYTTARGFIKANCEKHGEFISRVQNMAQGTGCLRCKTSKPQEKLLSYISEVYKGKILNNTRRYIGGKELDIFLPELNVAFEVNGVYWHSSKSPKKSPEWVKWHQADKLKLCKDEGIRLIHYFDDEIENKWEIVAKQVKCILGLVSERVYARNTKVTKIPWEQAAEFLNANHLQGSGVAGASWGLVHNGKLLSVMVFTSARGATNTSELSRFASSTQVVGGASKLLTTAISTLQTNSIISYSDNRYSEGNLYSVLGFKQSHTTPPDYSYVVGGKRIHKSLFSRKHLPARFGDKFDPALSEHENCEKMGIPRIYNCGITRWELNL